MILQNLIGYEINSAIEKIKQEYDKKIIIMDNNSNINNSNVTSVVRIKEYDDYIEIITSNFIYLD